MIRKNPVFMRVCGLSEKKSGDEKVEIHGSRSLFVDDTIHDGAEQKSFFLGWFLWIFQNIIDVFYLFPEIFFRDCFRRGGGRKHAVQFFLQALPFFGEPFFVGTVFLQCINSVFKCHFHTGFPDGQVCQSLLQPLDGFIVFLLLLPVTDGEREVRTGEDIIEVAVDGSLCFESTDKMCSRPLPSSWRRKLGTLIDLKANGGR